MRESKSRWRWRGDGRPTAEKFGAVPGTWDPSGSGPSRPLCGLSHMLKGSSGGHAQRPMLWCPPSVSDSLRGAEMS